MLAGMSTTAVEWTERVRAWRASGLSASEFARPAGYRGKTLSWWGSELKRRERVKREKASGAPQITMARVRVTRRSAEGDELISVVVGAARIAVRRGFDATLLREVVSALGAER
jgi:hypothetical protein